MSPNDRLFMHGWAYNGPVLKPKVLWASDQKPRKDHSAPDWLTATEYEDVDKVAAAKVRQLAQLMRLSRHTCVYSGAGISASAVGQVSRSPTSSNDRCPFPWAQTPHLWLVLHTALSD